MWEVMSFFSRLPVGYSITLLLDIFLSTITVFTTIIVFVVVAFVSFNLFHSIMYVFKINTNFFIFFCYLIYNFNAIYIKNALICMHAPACEKIFVWRFHSTSTQFIYKEY